MGLIPGRGTKIPQATWWSQKTNKRFSEVGNYPVIAIVTEVQRWVCTCSSFPLGWCYILEVFSNHPGYSHLVPRGFGMGRGEVFIIKEYIYTDCDILAYLSLRGYSAKKKKNHLRQVRFADYSEMSLGFDLIRCDEANRSGDNCHEGRSSYFQLPRNRRHGTQGHAGKHLGQSRGREGRGKHEHKPVFWLLWEKQGRAA